MFAFSAFYIIFIVCLIFPPSSFISAGLTVTNLCSPWLPSEDLQFIQHHIRRVAATVIFHSVLPLGYFIGLLIFEGIATLLNVLHSALWMTCLCLAFAYPACEIVRVFYWSRNNWEKHPLVRALKTVTIDNQSWREVASGINAEFRRIDKVTISTNPISKVVITDSWIIYVLPRSLNLVQQNLVTLQLMNSEEHNFSINSSTGTQYLLVQVEHVQTKEHLFSFRLNSLDYLDLQSRLSQPINNIRGITVHQDIQAQFSKVFIQHVEQNPKIQIAEELEPCLGCMQIPANTRLVRRCRSSGLSDSDCAPCFCRPMWCVHCLAKWFASRQDADHPETWLSSQCPCPTCRSPFCLLDVSLIEHTVVI